MKLSKNGKIKLTKDDDFLDKVTVGCSWKESNNVDIDTMLFLLNTKDTNPLQTTIYYGNKTTYGIKHYGDDTTGNNSQHDSDNEVISIDLSKVNSSVDKIVVVLNAYTGEKLSSVKSISCRVYSGEPGNITEVLGTYAVEDNSVKTQSVVVGVFNKNGREWEFEALGTGVKEHRVPELRDLFMNKGKVFNLLSIKPSTSNLVNQVDENPMNENHMNESQNAVEEQGFVGKILSKIFG